jgi:CMP-N-acetylneuraminic acid synthetase
MKLNSSFQRPEMLSNDAAPTLAMVHATNPIYEEKEKTLMQFVYSPQTFQEASFIDAAIRQFIVLKQC